MTISVDTKEWEARHGILSRTGSRYWRFRAKGATTGKGRPPRLDWALDTDGPWPTARDRAIKAAQEAFGRNAQITIYLIP